MRDDVLMRLMDRVMSDADFRRRLRSDLDGTLRIEDFQLTEDELMAVREFHRHTAGLGDAELELALADPVRRQQFAA